MSFLDYGVDLRPTAEIQRLTWKDIHFEDDKPSVYIHPDWKVKHGRWVDIPSCAVSLLHRCQEVIRSCC